MPSPARVASRTRRPLLALLALLVLLVIGYAAQAVQHHNNNSPTRSSSSPATAVSPTKSGSKTTAKGASAGTPLSTLPLQARQTVALIQKHGPFPYSQDGVVFQNNEHRLPSHPSGYYHEYTVKTPGSSDRGTRRIITGAAGEFYYTDDHYDSFKRVDVNS